MVGYKLPESPFNLEGAWTMIRKEHLDTRIVVKSSSESAQSKLTLFAIPKLFEGHVGVIQRNAIRSWAHLQPHIEIILFGQGDSELTEIANEIGARLLPLETNDSGTPILGDAFEKAHHWSTSDVLCYVNSDMIFGTELLEVADLLYRSEFASFWRSGRESTCRFHRNFQVVIFKVSAN